jgi:hypothetical protein
MFCNTKGDEVAPARGSHQHEWQVFGLDHCWTRHASLEASKEKCRKREEQNTLTDAILAFLREK